MHASKSTSTHTWDLHHIDSPQALYRLLIKEAISQKFGDNAIPDEETYYTHLDILDFALDTALRLLGVGTSWQPVVDALMHDQPIPIDLDHLIRACSPADTLLVER